MYATRHVSYPIKGIDPDKSVTNTNTDLEPISVIGKTGSGNSSNNRRQRIPKIKVKGFDVDRKNINVKFA